MTDMTTSDNSIPPGYPPSDHERDRLGMFGGDGIWRYLFPLLINQNDQKPLLTPAAFAEFREHVGGLMSIIGESIFLTDDTGPATLDSAIEAIDTERSRTSPAFAKFIDVLVEAKSDLGDAAIILSSVFASVEGGLEELADDLVEEAKDAAADAAAAVDGDVDQETENRGFSDKPEI